MKTETATEIFKRYYEEWEKNSSRMSSGYDYEKTYADMMQKVEQEVFQASVGNVPKSPNTKKNFKPVMGE